MTDLLNEEQAKLQAYQMHRKKVTYAKIEEYLKTRYKSSKTGSPVKAITIRHWVASMEQAEQEAASTAPAEEFMAGLKRLCSMEDLTPDFQKRMVMAYIKATEATEQ